MRRHASVGAQSDEEIVIRVVRLRLGTYAVKEREVGTFITRFIAGLGLALGWRVYALAS